MIMKMQIKLSYMVAGLLLASMAAGCGDDKNLYIPPALDELEPENPKDDVYNEISFTPHVEGQPYDSYKGLVMAGYQGWFGTPGDGCPHADHSNTAWYHYRESNVFKPGVLNNSIDFWPDVSEYPVKYDVPDFKYPDGTTAQVYSAYDESSVLLHFKWMQEAGIDGVFMQRFVGEVINNPDGKAHFDHVLEHAMKGSNQYQRAIAVMYDLGGYNTKDPNSATGTSALLADLAELESKYHFTNRDAGQKFYLYHNGKPLIALWGVGFPDKESSYGITDIDALVDQVKGMGFSVMLGVPTYWRSGINDAISDPMLKEVIKKADVIMPWFVGRYSMDNYSSFHTLISDDINWCRNEGVDYAPLCLPGSSDLHMHPNNGRQPRLGGKFFWSQLHYCIKAGAEMIYVAMFDEIDEGTAIFKCLNESKTPSNVPAEDYWVLYRGGNYYKRTSDYTGDLGPNDWCRKASEMNIPFYGIEDDLPTDHYLWLTGQARKMLNAEIPMTETLPER